MIEDRVEGKGAVSVSIPLYCAVKPEETGEGVRIGGMVLQLSGISLESMEEIPVSDRRMLVSWGERIWCLHLKTSISGNGSWKMAFVPLKSN